MYVITNRKVSKKVGGFKIFSKKANPKGVKELRLLEFNENNAEKKQFKLLENKLDIEKVKAIKNDFNLDIDETQKHFASLEVASKIFRQARDEDKQILVFIHGYNNDMQDAVYTALELERIYKVIVLIFSWPANGGNAITGLASYKSDKSDARSSEGALDKFFKKLQYYHLLFTKAEVDRLWQQAQIQHKNNPQKAKMKYVKLQKRLCRTTINLLVHSMGNYLLKYATFPTDGEIRKPIFNNICLAAADVNNKDHKTWIENIDVKSNLYVVINKKDSALAASRIKTGQEQLARLGHYTKSLNAQNATYIDITNADGVGTEHSYFKTSVEENQKLKKLFLDIFEGKDAEEDLVYRADTNCYVVA